jgi:osmoprotectant transport system ATP-binding protein
MLIYDSVVKQFGRAQGVGPLTLRVLPGHTVGVCGPPGAGKTTLLRLALGIVRPEAGVILVGGLPAAPPHLVAVRRRIGYVPRGGGSMPHLSTRDNATLAARSVGWPRAKREERLGYLCDLIRFPIGLLDEHPDRLSQRQQRRAWLLRALFLDPDLVLLDEPFAGAEAMSRHELVSDLQRALAEIRKAAVVTSERISDCARLTDDILLLRGGVVAQRGSIEALIDNPAETFVREYVKSHGGDLRGP